MDAKQKAKTETIPYSISAYAVMLTLVSFLGFLIENTWIVLTEGFVDNRNMNAPFLIGYGVIVLLIYRFMGTPEQLTGILQFARGWTRHGRISLYFLTSFFVVCSVEILTGYVVEKVCSLYYWSYEALPRSCQGLLWRTVHVQNHNNIRYQSQVRLQALPAGILS